MSIAKITISFMTVFLFSLQVSLAHGEQSSTSGLTKLSDTALTIILIATGIVSSLTVTAIATRNKSDRTKWLLFGGIAIAVFIATAYSAISTIYLNLNSASQGPVHWHADFEMWNCGNNVALAEPSGISNRIGTSDFHEHGDMRIHVEGVVVNLEDVNLHNFLESIGGEMTNDKIVIPTTRGLLELENGDLCNGEEGKLQVFLYKIVNPDPKKKSGFIFTQQKLDDFGYVLSPYGNVPPGDCLIIDFDVEKNTTNHMCESYEVALDRGDISGG